MVQAVKKLVRAARPAAETKRQLTVAEYLTKQIEMSSKRQNEIAKEIGYDRPNVITMMKMGHTKVPINKVGPLALALGLDPVHLLRLVMSEYQPDTWQAIQDVIGHSPVTQNEQEILAVIRKENNSDPEIPNDKKRDELRHWARSLE